MFLKIQTSGNSHFIAEVDEPSQKDSRHFWSYGLLATNCQIITSEFFSIYTIGQRSFYHNNLIIIDTITFCIFVLPWLQLVFVCPQAEDFPCLELESVCCVPNSHENWRISAAHNAEIWHPVASYYCQSTETLIWNSVLHLPTPLKYLFLWTRQTCGFLRMNSKP